MPSREIRVDVRLIEDFSSRLAPRLRQVSSALTTLTRVDGPPLGHFHHAKQVGQHYEALHGEFVARARRLLTAMVVAQAGTDAIAAAYGTSWDLTHSRLTAIAEALTHADGVRRAAALRAAGLDATLFQEAARYEATLPPAPVAEATGAVDGHGRA